MHTRPHRFRLLALIVATALLAPGATRSFAQNAPPTPPKAVPPTATPAPTPPPPAGAVQAWMEWTIDPNTGQPIHAGQPPEKRFDFDFAGGSPAKLIEVLSKARERTVNAIIPEELADTVLPAMRLKQVTVPQVFEALTAASHKTVTTVSGTFAGVPGNPMRSYQQRDTSFGFKTSGNSYDGDAIWYFYCDRPNVMEETQPAEMVRFYQMARFLDTYKIDDITTAIQTGWKLGGPANMNLPQLSFHKETKLLIVRARPDLLQVIDDVLKELDKGLQPAAASHPFGGPVAPRPAAVAAPLPGPAPAR